MIRMNGYLKKTTAWILILLTLLFPLHAIPEGTGDEQWLVDDSAEERNRVKELIEILPLQEKICQLFFIAPEQISKKIPVYTVNETFLSAFSRFPVGGIILFSRNIRSASLHSIRSRPLVSARRFTHPSMDAVSRYDGLLVRKIAD